MIGDTLQEMQFYMYIDIHIIHINNDIEIGVTLSMMKKIIKVHNKLIVHPNKT